MQLSGIYLITFIGASKSYIGSSFDLCTRGNHHLNALKKNKHRNKHLQRAFNKYGYDCFVFDILEQVNLSSYSDKKEKDIVLRKIEQEYLDKWLCANSDDSYFRKNSYNIAKKTVGGSGKSLIGKNHPKHKKVSVFDLNMNFIEEIAGLRAAERKYNITTIRSCCNGKASKCGNHIFRWSDNLDVKWTKSTYSPKGIPKAKKNPVYEYNSITGEFVKEWRCAEEATNQLGLNAGTISRILSGEYKNVKDKTFRKFKVDRIEPQKVRIIQEHPTIIVYDLKNKPLMEFQTYNEVRKALGVSRATVSTKCKDNSSYNNKYYFKFKTN